MEKIIKKVHVCAPFILLVERYLDKFIDYGLNPEIALNAAALDRYTFSDFKRIADAFHSNGQRITIHAPFMDLAPGSPDPEIRKVVRHRFRQVLDLIPAFNPLSVVCHVAYDWKRYAFIREDWIENSLDTWSWLAKNLDDAGSGLMLENVYERGPEEIKVLFDNLGENKVGFCLDMGHVNAFSSVPLQEWLQALGPHIGQLHLHDNHGKKDDHIGLGMGTTDFQPLFDYLNNRTQPPPIVTLEPHEEKYLWPSLEFLKTHLPW